MPDPMLFERSPHRYLRARPPYPDQVWDLLGRLDIAREGARVLDLGAGTGLATGALVERGAQVDAIEPGTGLASLLREQFPQVKVQIATAEAASYPAEAYDGVVAATALHWMDLSVVLPRVHQCLHADGRFVPFWNVFFDPEAEPTPFREVINAMFDSVPTTRGTPLDREHWSEKLTQTGLFEVESVHTWRWAHQMTSRQLNDLVSTFNGWSDDHIATATEAAERLGGSVTEQYTTIAYVCAPLAD